MTKCPNKCIPFSNLKKRKIEAEFIDKDVSSDAGVLLLREIDKQLNLTERLAVIIPDQRDPNRITHSLESLLKQRIYGLALGYEDLNDHDELRRDPAIQTAVDRTETLGSSSTLCRLENTATREVAFQAHEIIVDEFIKSFSSPPKELVLDFDPTDDPTYGQQEKHHYHGYYKNYCFLPLHVFCGSQLLVSYLRPSNIDGAKHAGPILSLLVKKFRSVWPNVKIIFRGDGGFARHILLGWCERNGVYYIVGIGKNKRLEKFSKQWREKAEKQFEQTQEKQKHFGEFSYAADTWKRKRRIICKAEYTDKGANTRYVVTNLDHKPADLYNEIYCLRGDMENRIKELKLDLHSGRTSCNDWWANQFRLLLSSMAYVLLDSLRRNVLQETELEKASCQTIRLRLFKIGAIIIRNTRRIRFLLSNHFPYKSLFHNSALSLYPG